MLSLTPKAKAKLAELTNKSVLYGFVLNEDDVGDTHRYLNSWTLLTVAG